MRKCLCTPLMLLAFSTFSWGQEPTHETAPAPVAAEAAVAVETPADSVATHAEVAAPADSLAAHAEAPKDSVVAPAVVEAPKDSVVAPAVVEAPPATVEQPAVQVAEPAKEKSGQGWYKNIEFGAGLGVFGGASFHLGYRFSGNFLMNRLGVRLNYNTIKPVWDVFKSSLNDSGQEVLEDDISIRGVEISNSKFKADVSGSQLGLLLDIHPFGFMWGLGGLRVSGGYYIGSTSASAKIHSYVIDVKQEVKSSMGEAEVTANVSDKWDDMDPLSMKLNFNASGPYVGAGYDLGLLFGLHLTFDAGVVFTNNPHKISLTLPKLEINKNSTVIEITNDTQKDALLAQFEKDGFCGAGKVINCDDLLIGETLEVPESIFELFWEEYSDFIADFNEKVEKETKSALNGNKKKGDRKNGINTVLKDYNYFPIIRVGFMFRF